MVADRPTAQAAVSHFEQHRVGLATCKILSELQPAAGAAAQAAAGAGAAAGSLQPLAACVEARPEVPGTAALVQHLLQNWWLALSRQVALDAVQQDRQGGGRRRRSIVTVQVRPGWQCFALLHLPVESLPMESCPCCLCCGCFQPSPAHGTKC